MTSAAGSNFPRVAVTTYLLTLGAIFAAGFFPEQRLWGLNWYGYFDWYVWLALAAAVLIVPVVMSGWRQDRDQSDTPPPPGRSLFPLFAFLIIITAGVAFYFFRGQTHFLGDGYQLLTWLQDGVHHKPWERGTFLVLNSVYQLLGGTGESAAQVALQIVSCSSGLILLVATAITAARLYQTTADRLLFMLGIATCGYMLLFFGYFESYPLFVMTVGLFGQVGLLVVRGRAPRWLVAPILALALFFHIFGVVLVPAAIYLLLQGTMLGDRLGGQSRSIKLATLGCVIMAGGIVFMFYFTHSYFFRFTIVPPVSDVYTVEGYTMFSVVHILDYLNLVFLLCPAWVVAILSFRRVDAIRLSKRRDYRFLATMLIPALVLPFIFNPGLGMPRDWDLFSFAGLPLVILFYYLLLDRDGPRHGPRIAVLGIILGLLLLGPRVATQVIPEKGITLFDRYAALDRIKNSSGRFIVREYLKDQGRTDEAEWRRRIDNEILPEGEWVETARKLIGEGRIKAGVALLFKAIKSDPSRYMAWANLGVVCASRGLYDSARYYYEVAAARMPFNAAIYNNLADVYVALEEYDRAENILLEVCDLAPDDFVPRRILLRLYDRWGRFEDYRVLLERLTERKDVPPDILFQAARSKLWAWDMPAAGKLLHRALNAGLDTAIVCELQAQYPELEVLDCDE